MKFSLCSQHVPQHILNSSSHNPYPLPWVVLLITCMKQPKWGYYNMSILGLSKDWFFLKIFLVSQ
jgi:hypothetical protein